MLTTLQIRDLHWHWPPYRWGTHTDTDHLTDKGPMLTQTTLQLRDPHRLWPPYRYRTHTDNGHPTGKGPTLMLTTLQIRDPSWYWPPYRWGIQADADHLTGRGPVHTGSINLSTLSIHSCIHPCICRVLKSMLVVHYSWHLLRWRVSRILSRRWESFELSFSH